MTILLKAITSWGTNPSSNGGINWTDNQMVQLALYQSCDELVNSDGSLTDQGQHAFYCIRNGALLGGGAKLLVPVAPTGMIIRGLEMLAGPTGCGGIVKLDALRQISGLGSIISGTSIALRSGFIIAKLRNYPGYPGNNYRTVSI